MARDPFEKIPMSTPKKAPEIIPATVWHCSCGASNFTHDQHCRRCARSKEWNMDKQAMARMIGRHYMDYV